MQRYRYDDVVHRLGRIRLAADPIRAAHLADVLGIVRKPCGLEGTDEWSRGGAAQWLPAAEPAYHEAVTVCTSNS